MLESLENKINNATERKTNKPKEEVRHIIWSNRNLDVNDDWKEAYAEHLEANRLAGDPDNENEVYNYMVETNGYYLDDERANLDIQLNQSILVIADIGRWNGRFGDYKEILSGNIKDCLSTNEDYAEWYVDKNGDLRGDVVHHDGTNHYLYRVYKDNVTETQIENLKDKILEGKATRADITRITKRLGDEIAKVYGWDISKVKQDKEQQER